MPIGLFVLAYYTGLDEWFKFYFGLEFYHLFLIVAALLTIFWTDKRYRISQKQYKQTEDSIFKNKVNTIYLEVIKLLSDDEINKLALANKKKLTAANLIKSIQASIYTHYESEKERRDAQFTILNFQGMNLKNADLTGVNLAGANLENANLADANLENANLANANLINTVLIDASLINTVLIGASLKNADLVGANLLYANLENAYLKNAYLKNADLAVTNLHYANLENANLENACLKNADLENANFGKAKNIPDWIKDKLDNEGIYRE